MPKSKVYINGEYYPTSGAGVIALGGRQGNIPTDSTPTASSLNPITSGGVKVSVDNLQDQIDALVSRSDVVDVVGTYAELLAYPTTELGDNDIIKVLQDETRSNAITYYRWVLSSTTWSFVGSSGPFYTKGEADARFNAMITSSTSLTAQTIDAGLIYSTEVPTAANPNGIKIVVLSSEPATKYSGWLYIITG